MPALDQNCEVHIRPDGSTLTCLIFLRSNNEWTAGPALSEAVLGDAERWAAWWQELLKTVKRKKAKSLGVVLHIGDEFATAELKPSFEDPDSLAELRDLASSDPMAILDDSSIQPDQHAWRVIPYAPQAEEPIGTAVTVGRDYERFLAALREAGREANFPVSTVALSAPLVALTALPSCASLTKGQPFVAILQYPWFTALAFFNREGNLRLIRTQLHRGQKRPPNFRRTIATANASLEFQDPDLFVMPLGEHVDTMLVQDLQSTFTSSRVELVRPPVPEGLHSWCPEPAIATTPVPEEEPFSRTFGILRKEGWAFQDFLSIAREELELFPTRQEMQLLKFARLGRVALAGVTVLTLAWFGFGAASTLRKPEWAFNPDSATSVKKRMMALNAEKVRISHLDNLLADRSKGWANMEFIARLIPEGAGIRTREIVHTIRPAATPGQSTVGFIKEWSVSGFVRAEGMEYLQSLNSREGLHSLFNNVADTIGDDSFRINLGNRSVVANVRTRENSSFRQRPAHDIINLDDSTYPLIFDLTITQRFETTDPLALNVSAMTQTKAIQPAKANLSSPP